MILLAAGSAGTRFAPYAGLVLVIRADLVEAIMAHARSEGLDEACGILAGPEGGERPQRHVPMRNAAKDATGPIVVKGRERSARTYFDWVPREKLRVYRELDDRDEWAVVTYHSHTHTEAYPSDVDVDNMSGPLVDPRTHWVIVSTRDGATPTAAGHEFRSFRIAPGADGTAAVVEEEVQVVETYMFAHTGADAIPPED